jgi:4-hydroxybenzoate polyprenyltransferase
MPTFTKATAGKPARSKARSYLLLSRVSNLPTVWTNVLAAYVCAAAALDSLPLAIVSLTLFYTAGMLLNDVCDVPFDRTARSDRPIPSGDVGRREALVVTILLFIGAELVLIREPHARPAMMWGAGLIAAITLYDLSHKGKWYGPVVMGLCRALVYCVAASGAVGVVTTPVFVAAAIMWIYVIALTWVAKAANLGYAVPWMLAGICLIDALIILWMGQPRLAALAALGFPLTLAFQRVVPGT